MTGTHVIVESVKAFSEALRRLPAKEVRWYTSTPMVVETLVSEGREVRWLEDFLSKDVPDRIGEAAFDAVHDMADGIDEAGRSRGIPGAHHFAALPLQRLIACLLYKQCVLESWLKATGPSHVVVGDSHLTPPGRGNIGIDRFDTLFAVLASRCDRPRLEVIETGHEERGRLYGDIDKMPPLDRVVSWADFSPSQLLYRLLRYATGCKGVSGAKGSPRVRILRENELIRESLPHLLRRRAGVCFERRLKGRGDREPLFGPELDGDLKESVLGACRVRGLPLDGGESIIPLIVERLREVSRCWLPFFLEARERVALWKREKRPQVLVSNTLSGPENVALSLAAREAGIPVCVVEHGVSAGISHFHEPLRPFSEVSHCDFYLACSRNAVDFNDREPRIRGKSIAVGLASQVRKIPMGPLQRVVSRRRLGAKSEDRVVVFLTRACQNNIRMLPHSPEDRDVHRFESVMCRQVMPHVRGLPVIKFYNTRRHWDSHPFVARFRAPAPVRTLQAGDFRFFRAGVDIIILQSPMSTLGWAFGTGKPIFYVEHPEIKLLPHVREAMSEAIFLFSTEKGTWVEDLLGSLNRPDQDITAAWASMARKRKAFLDRFVFGPKRAGFRSAVLIEHMAILSHQNAEESNPVGADNNQLISFT